MPNLVVIYLPLLEHPQRAATPLPIQQDNVEFNLELLDRLADRGLRREHYFGSLGKATLAHDFDESAKGPKIIRILFNNTVQSINSFFSYSAEI
jgi:hypothetical protein